MPEPDEGEDQGDNLLSLSLFAEEDPTAYLRSYIDAARALFDLGEKALQPNALCFVLVHIYRHSITLKLKQLTIYAAKSLRKPLTTNHIRTIDRLSISQLWSNLSLMLEQLGANSLKEKPSGWYRMDVQILQLVEYDSDFCALRSASGFASDRRGKASPIKRASPSSPPLVELNRMLEGLSNHLLWIEDWMKEKGRTGKNDA